MNAFATIAIRIVVLAAAVYFIRLPDPGFFAKVHGPILASLALIMTLSDALLGVFKKSLSELVGINAVPIADLESWIAKIHANRRHSRVLWLSATALRIVVVVCGACLQYDVSGPAILTLSPRVFCGIVGYTALVSGVFVALRAWTLSEYAEDIITDFKRQQRVLEEEKRLKEEGLKQAAVLGVSSDDKPPAPYPRIGIAPSA